MHKCTYDGCSRSFKRPEHLSRHRLNHQPRTIHECSICHKDFVRLDLLQRHLRRHDRGMVKYRNSGGYSTRVELPLRHADVQKSEEPGSGPASEYKPEQKQLPSRAKSEYSHHVSESPLSSMSQDVLDPVLIQAAQLASQENGYLAPGNTSEPMQQLTFFHGPSDGTWFTQDLDWLFGASPEEVPSRFGDFQPISHSSPLESFPGSFVPPPCHNQDSDFIDPVSRQRVMEALSSLPSELLTSTFFDAANLQMFMQKYWLEYNPHFQMLHRPSFVVADVPPLLLVSLLTLGATLSPDDSHYAVAEKIHQNLRWLIFTLMRRGSCYSAGQTTSGDLSNLENTWHRWIEQELTHRAAYFAFVMDAQHSSIFGHAAVLSLTDIRLPLPCSEAVWDAPTASAWNRERSRQPSSTPFFLPALRALLCRQPLPHTYSTFARFVLLHGLFSLTRHMTIRDQTASFIGGNSFSRHADPEVNITSASASPHPEDDDDWRERVARAVDTWSLSLFSRSPSLCLEAAKPLQHIAHINIHTNLIDFHILAGAPNLATGVRAHPASMSGDSQYARACERVQAWTRDLTNAKQTLIHCLTLIQETMFTRAQYLACEDNILLRPWVLYHSTLVVWAYGVLTEGIQLGGVCSAEDYLSHMLNHLLGNGDISQLRGTNQTSGLVASVSAALDNCRWELLQEAKETLDSLGPQSRLLLSVRGSTAFSEVTRERTVGMPEQWCGEAKPQLPLQ
ncbi:hypothetical protein MCOR02_010048 [Pyricularia oryzae]|uniref:C2H2-type domain-containing protein n=2 Tax=Pyricularia TaxID=48558 RepID=A0ABQ8NXA1_PYRGI|nr:hypothetical protein MCOR02_010048 [Pyricularia oryzae]KAI6302490.1 hypothetical protein MCOR33_002231 [Pyricularia grisea]KAI6257661.1 hypothetical protein MCOR19_005939 [Pyricularia oryzae]KAI6268718.1 hypothetical protein MCOR26_009073 [Pyricularia oryzae]KAI6316467.1 hypothetical protein MCOR29_006686 [Pyricularia oryzae]